MLCTGDCTTTAEGAIASSETASTLSIRWNISPNSGHHYRHHDQLILDGPRSTTSPYSPRYVSFAHCDTRLKQRDERTGFPGGFMVAGFKWMVGLHGFTIVGLVNIPTVTVGIRVLRVEMGPDTDILPCALKDSTRSRLARAVNPPGSCSMLTLDLMPLFGGLSPRNTY